MFPRSRFGVALDVLLTGQCKAIRRHWWNENVKVKLEDVGDGKKDLVVTTTTTKTLYCPDRNDIFANDWEYGMISCTACGEPLHEVEINVFDRDGSDYWKTVEIAVSGEWACLTTCENWTGEDQSLEEKREAVRCPHCKKFPFPNRDIEEDRPLSVIFHLGDDSDA